MDESINSKKQVIYITRHGHRLDWVDEDWRARFQFPFLVEDSPLSEIGKDQAKQLANLLLKDPNITHVFSSPFYRTVETAHEIAQVLDCKIYIEHSISEWIPKIMPGIEYFSEEYFKKWTNRKSTEYKSLQNIIQEIETLTQLHQRARFLVKKIESDFTEKGNLVFVCHAASHIALVRAFMNDPQLDVSPGTCCLTKLVREGDRWDIEKLSDFSHLKKEYQVKEIFSPWGVPPAMQIELKDFSFD